MLRLLKYLVPSGSSIRLVVIIHNNSGRPLSSKRCGRRGVQEAGHGFSSAQWDQDRRPCLGNLGAKVGFHATEPRPLGPVLPEPPGPGPSGVFLTAGPMCMTRPVSEGAGVRGQRALEGTARGHETLHSKRALKTCPDQSEAGGQALGTTCPNVPKRPQRFPKLRTPWLPPLGRTGTGPR